MQRLLLRFPPKEGLRYILGTWNIPWIIKFEMSLTRQDKLKCKIANKPKSDLACAYFMGLQDGSRGKFDAQHQALGCNDSECHRCIEPRYNWPKVYRVTDGQWYLTGQGTEYKAFEEPKT